MVCDGKDAELFTDYGVDHREREMLHDEPMLAVTPLAPEARILQQRGDGTFKLRKQGLLQSHTGVVAVKLCCLP